MWIFTKDGFFAITRDRYCKSGEIIVRSPCKQDLLHLHEKFWGFKDDARIFGIKHAAFRFQMKVKLHMWTEYLVQAALSINYTGLTHMISKNEPLRKEAYGKVTEVLSEWQTQLEAGEPDPVPEAETSQTLKAALLKAIEKANQLNVDEPLLVIINNPSPSPSDPPGNDD